MSRPALKEVEGTAIYLAAVDHYLIYCKAWPERRLAEAIEKTSAAVQSIPNCCDVIKLFALGKKDALRKLLEERRQPHES